MSYRGSEETPCRSCTSFTEYIKQNKKKYNAEVKSKKEFEVQSNKDILVLPENCPLDKDELGRNTWGFLHTMAARYPNNPSKDDQKDMKRFFYIFSKFYPCTTCAEEFREDMKCNPPKTESQEALSQWLCVMHNKVNIKLGKPEFDCSKVNERWRDGWLDGSCG